GDEAAWLSAIAMMSMPLTVGFAHMVIFDSALSFFITAALIFFYLACHPERSEGPGWAGGATADGLRAAPPPRSLAPARDDTIGVIGAPRPGDNLTCSAA